MIPRAFLRFWAASLLLVCAQQTQATAISLKQRHDPFYQGPSAEFTFNDTRGSDESTASTIFQAEYAWDTGTAAQLQVPLIVGATNPANSGNTIPRIGGGANSRVEADGLFRAWGDTYDYLAFNVGLGLPWQTSSVNRDSSLNSWLLALAIFGRADWDWIAVEGRLNDSPSFPASYVKNGQEIFADSSNTVSINATVYTYPNRWLAPHIYYSETFPSAVNYSYNLGPTYLPLSQSQNGRTRVLGFGADFAPKSIPALITLDFNYILVTPTIAGTEISGVGEIRWLF